MTSKLASGLSLSSFRIEGEGQNPYLNDARLHTCLLLQRVIFEKQSKKFASILATQSDKTSSRISVEDFNASLPSNNILKRRNMTDDNQSQKRLLDDIEMTLLGILDSDNCISLASRLSDFILLMTRITRLDHRALCLHILGNSLSPACSKQFLADGGFKILKRWIKQAGLEDNVDELCTIVMLCAKLPFDKDAAKQTQIGKYIKKFLKYKSASNQDTTKLCKEIDYLIKTWYEAFSDAVKEQLNAAPENPAQENVQPSKISTTIVATLAQRLFEDRGPPKVFLPFVDISATELPPAAPVAADHKVVDLANPAAPGRTSNPLAAAPAKTPASAAAAAAAAAAKKPATATTTQNPTLASAKPASHTQPAVHSIKKIDNPSATATKPSSTAVDSSASASSSSNEADSGNKPTQSAATAAASTLTRTAKVPAGKINMAEQARKVAAQKQAQELAASAARDANISRPASNRGNDIDPGRSILKRMSDSTDGPSSKRAKLDVKFADDHGKDIAEVQYFEVEFLKRSWVGEKSKKSHKEMMKRERMIEKNDLMTKNRSSMQRTTDWSTPAPLVLSLEITENSHNPITSPESEEQNKRIQHTLEARYVDESLIPLDPDEVAGMADDEAPDTRVIYIEWETENVMNQPAVGSLQHDVMPSLYSAIPQCLHGLEPELLQVLVNDESHIMQLLNDDGSVNQHKVVLFRQHIFSQRGAVGLQQQHQMNQFHAPPINPAMGYMPPLPPPPHFQPHPTFPPQQHMLYEQPPPPPQFQQQFQHQQGRGAGQPKVQQPCRFFNSPTGCTLGDRCQFGHFGVVNAPPSFMGGINNNNNRNGGSRWG